MRHYASFEAFRFVRRGHGLQALACLVPPVADMGHCTLWAAMEFSHSLGQNRPPSALPRALAIGVSFCQRTASGAGRSLVN
jgi:hypothetical protein